MSDLLLRLDITLFRWFNGILVHPWLDVLARLGSGMYLMPVVILAVVLFAWKGRIRGRVCLFVLLVAISLADGGVTSFLKQAIGRLRPPQQLEGVRLLVGVGQSKGMPSAHAANWFTALTVFFFFYRRSLWIFLPAAIIVSWSRVYNGVHYPFDVLVGALVGMLCGLLTTNVLQWVWCHPVRRWFPLWQARLPSLRNPPDRLAPAAAVVDPQAAARHWIRLGYLLIAAFLLLTLWILSSSHFSAQRG
jgi:undecaprenyl-diphosphatase